MVKISKKMWLALIATGVITSVAIVNRHHAGSMLAIGPAVTERQDINWKNPFRKSSPAYHEADEFIAWLATHETLNDVLRNRSQSDRFNFASALEPKGMQRLSNELIEEFIPLMAKMLNSFDEEDCASLLRGKISFDELRGQELPVLESFSETEAKTWFLISRSAIDAELKNLPLVSLPKETARAGVLRIAGSLPLRDGKSFLLHLENLPQESDENICSAVRTLFAGTPLLPEPYRAAVARMLVDGKPQGPNN